MVLLDPEPNKTIALARVQCCHGRFSSCLDLLRGCECAVVVAWDQIFNPSHLPSFYCCTLFLEQPR